MVSVLASSAEGRGFDPRPGQTNGKDTAKKFQLTFSLLFLYYLVYI